MFLRKYILLNLEKNKRMEDRVAPMISMFQMSSLAPLSKSSNLQEITVLFYILVYTSACIAANPYLLPVSQRLHRSYMFEPEIKLLISLLLEQVYCSIGSV